MLLVVSLGLSVVCESLGRTMLRCQILAGGHFIFGSMLTLIIIRVCILMKVYISTVRYRYCRIKTRVDVRARASALCDPAWVHIEWIPFVDHALTEWFFFIYLP